MNILAFSAVTMRDAVMRLHNSSPGPSIPDGFLFFLFLPVS
jgi:hypothetical protein